LNALKSSGVRALVAMAIAILLGVPAASSAAVKSEQAVYAAIVAAYHKLNTLAGYRIKILETAGSQRTTVASGVVATLTVPKTTERFDVTPPDKVRHTIYLGREYHESIAVGTKKATKSTVSGGAHDWECHPASAGAALRLGPGGVPPPGAIAVRKPDTAISGIPVHDYQVTVPVSPTWIVTTDFYVDTRTGLPVRSVETSSKRGSATAGGSQTTDYYDYGATISITLPAACA